MTWSTLISRTHLSPFLKNLHFSSLESRCLFIVPGGSSNKFINSNTGLQQSFAFNVWSSQFGREFSTRSLNQHRCPSAFASHYVGREIVVQFNADVADEMPWKFSPTQREVKVQLGESALAFYTVENKTAKPITGVSTYNVTPLKAALYFNKIQCFCFEEQIDMPVFFYVDLEYDIT